MIIDSLLLPLVQGSPGQAVLGQSGVWSLRGCALSLLAGSGAHCNYCSNGAEIMLRAFAAYGHGPLSRIAPPRTTPTFAHVTATRVSQTPAPPGPFARSSAARPALEITMGASCPPDCVDRRHGSSSKATGPQSIWANQVLPRWGGSHVLLGQSPAGGVRWGRIKPGPAIS